MKLVAIALLVPAAFVTAQDWARRPPQVLFRSEPPYTDEARRAGVNATVKLTLVVNEQGLPEKIHVVRRAGFGLDESAVQTVETWRFQPGSKAGKETSAPVSLELNFRTLDKTRAGQTARLNFDLPAGVARPVLIDGKIPPNPEPAASAFLNIRLTVNPDGTAANFKTLQSDNPQWQAQVLEQMSHWRFNPGAGEVNGVFELSFSQPVSADNQPSLRRQIVRISRPDPEDASLPAPQLIAPPDHALFDSYPRRLSCKWAPAAGALSYLLEWDYMEHDAWHAESQGIPGTAFVVNGTKYTFNFTGAQSGRWRVWPVNNTGQRGNPSEWRTFRYSR
jgi:TonB family protein